MPQVNIKGSSQVGWDRGVAPTGWIGGVNTIDATTGDADAALGVAERDYATTIALANAIGWTCPPDITTVEIRFLSVTDGDDAVIDLWGRRKGDTEMVRIVTLTIKTGTQDAHNATQHYADTITVSNEAWPKALASVIPAAEHQGRLFFDLCGYEELIFHGHTTVDADFDVEISGFSG